MIRSKILVVEDEPLIIELLENVLHHLGYNVVTTVSSGEDALKKVAETSPDLVLMDIQLSGIMDGVETAQHLYNQYNLPVIYLTAYDDEKILERAKITSPFGYILKPFEERELHIAIEIALYKHKLERQIRQINEQLEQRVNERTAELEHTNKVLKQSMEALHITLTQLAEAEKMAALGGLVAGMAHEISNPLGVGMLAISHLREVTQGTFSNLRKGSLKRSTLENYFHNAQESISILQTNLNRAAELLNSFKQIAADQTYEQTREFFLAEYIEEILLSLRPRLKKTNHTITVECPESLKINSYPGIFSQILTNLIMNSLIHGFEDMPSGQIRIRLTLENEILSVEYTDDGKGIPADNLHQIFDLFYTTKREEGSSGLGLNIIYNLITQTLGGRISCKSTIGEGTSFFMDIPLHNTTHRSHTRETPGSLLNTFHQQEEQSGNSL